MSKKNDKSLGFYISHEKCLKVFYSHERSLKSIATLYGLHHEKGCNFTPLPSGDKCKMWYQAQKGKKKVLKMSMDTIIKMIDNFSFN